MTKNQILKVLLEYEKLIGEKVYGVEQFSCRDRHPKWHEALRHIRWMINQIRIFLDENQELKTQRWLGFIQGVIWAHDLYSIEELREHNRRKN